MMNKEGKLFLVATPIGNLEDITLRALRILKEVDEILCEDTRQTIKLLNHYDIHNRLTAYHKFNEKSSLEKIIAKLNDGERVALVSDAGLPLISDPGHLLVEACRENNIPVEVIPGANAALSALLLSGLDTSSFTFFGFPDKDKKKRQYFLGKVLSSPQTAIVYESPHHLVRTLEAVNDIDPDRKISVSREITKKFEETITGNPGELIEHFKEKPPKGEFVLVIERGKETAKTETSKSVEDLYSEYLGQGMSDKQAIKQVARDKNLSKREVYARLKIDR